MGLVAPWHVGSSLTRDQSCVPRIGRQILNYWTTREVLEGGFLTTESSGKSLNVEFFVFRAGKLWDTRNLIFLRELVTLPHSY